MTTSPTQPGRHAKPATDTEVDAGTDVTDDAPAAQGMKTSLLRVHHLRPAPGARKDRTRVGRGDGSKGKSAGRGTKGTGARKNVPAGFEGGQLPLQIRVPKLKGHTKSMPASSRPSGPRSVDYQPVNLHQIQESFPDGGEVGVADLANAGLVRRNQPVKVLGEGEFTVAVTVSAHRFSASAKDKITAAGGSFTQL
jgi:large subunit ribosomal protein L15